MSWGWVFFGVAVGWQLGCMFGAWAARKGYVIGARPDPTYRGDQNAR